MSNFSSRLTIVVLSASLAWLSSFLAPAPAFAQKKTCHLLIFADTADPKIGDSVKIDANAMTKIFEDNIPNSQLRITRLDGSRLTGPAILRTIRNHPVRAQDTLIVYYSGHGAFDRTQGHYFLAGRQANRNVLRTTVRQAMQSKGVRLNVLLSDCCSNMLPLPGRPKGHAELMQFLTRARPALASLCWKPSGFVDMNSCKRGQVALGNNLDGGFFTSRLSKFLRENMQREVSWPMLAGYVKTATSRMFRQKNPNGYTYRTGSRWLVQRDQNPTVRMIIGEGSLVRSGVRFGVRAQLRNGRLIVTEVIDGSPATRVRLAGSPEPQKLEVNDVLLTINNRRVRSERDFSRAIDRSGREMTVAIRNHRDGKRYQLRVSLAY